MHNKLLPIKEDKNVSLYSINYEAYSLAEFFKQIEKKYSYSETVSIETTIYDGVVLSMNEYDSKKDICFVNPKYKILKEIEKINEHERRCIIEIEVVYYSQIAKILKETFLDNMPLLNSTSLILLMKSIYNFRNNFSYNTLIDKKNLEWDDPRRLSDIKFDLFKINQKLNSRVIKFNKLERENTFEIVCGIVETLHSYITIEQIGLFSIEENMPEFNSLLAAFAVRNEDSTLFFGSLENVNLDFNGMELVNMRRKEIMNAYNLKEGLAEPQKQKNRMDVFNKFLQF